MAPAKHTIWLADYWGGMMGATQVLAALYWRDKVSGEGTFIEYSQVHGVTRQLEYALPLYGRYGITRERWGNWDTQLCVHGIIKCGKSSYPNSENPQEQEEGYILVSAYEDKDFARLWQTVGDGKLAEKYSKQNIRVKPQSQIEIYTWLEKWAADKSKEQVAATLDKANIINQPVWHSKEVRMDEAFFLVRRHQNMYMDISGIPPQKLLEYFPRLEEIADKVLFGTDWPGPGAGDVRGNIEKFLALPLGQEAQRKILYENAARLFPLSK